jgi:ABC-type transport system substrate-binding protein
MLTGTAGPAPPPPALPERIEIRPVDDEPAQPHRGPEAFQVKGWGGLGPSSIGYSPELDPFAFEPAKARQLLADAGYPGGKGFGKLIIDTSVSRATPLVPESAQLAADFWRKELGLDVEVKVGEDSDLTRRRGTGELDGRVLWQDTAAKLDRSATALRRYGLPGYADRRHDNPELFAFTKKGVEVFEPTEIHVALNNVYRRVVDEAYEIGVGYANIPWAVGPRVLAWQPWPLMAYPSNLHGITLK